jgi:glucosylceramidase
MLMAMQSLETVRHQERGSHTFVVRRTWAGLPLTLLLTVLLITSTACAGPHKDAQPTESPTQPTSAGAAHQALVWMTTADGTSTLAQRPAAAFQSGNLPGTDAVVSVNTLKRYQRFSGVGASMTGASASLIGVLAPAERKKLMAQLFSRTDGAGLSVLRQPLGASDFSLADRSYDDAPPGQTDRALRRFSLGSDARTVLPLVRQAKQLNGSLKVVATPWSAPGWMKTSDQLVGGTLRPDMGEPYARYLVRTLQAYRDAGVDVGAMTLQNEPAFSPPGYAGMTLSVAQQRTLLDKHLAPALAAAGLKPDVWGLDDNFSRTGDAAALLADPVTRGHLAGIAFHCYKGTPADMAQFRDKHPDVPVAISECTSGGWAETFSHALEWDVRNLLITGIRSGAAWVTKWNVALDPTGGPTNGGCRDCRGLVTIDAKTGAVKRNADYWALAHVGRFVIPGADVVDSTSQPDGIETVAFANPDGSHVLLATNAGGTQASFRVRADDRWFRYTLPAGAVATFTW